MKFLPRRVSTRHQKRYLYVAFYIRPKHPTVHHEALLLGPRDIKWSSQGVGKFHVKSSLQLVEGAAEQVWVYECVTIPLLEDEARLLAVVQVGVTHLSSAELDEILSRVQMPQESNPNGDSTSSLVGQMWVTRAIKEAQGVVIGITDWPDRRHDAYEAIQQQKTKRRWPRGVEAAAEAPLLVIR